MDRLQEWIVVLLLIWATYGKGISLIISSILTLAHATEEVYGDGGPLWDYFSQLSKVRIPSWLGVISIGILVPATLLIVAYHAYLEPSPWFIGLLVGLRLGDFLFSHLGPRIVWQKVNPGFLSSWGYLVEGSLVTYTYCCLNVWAVVLGAAVFALVLPTLFLINFIQRTYKEMNK